MRLTIFVSSEIDAAALSRVWEDMVGEPPETKTSRARETIQEQVGPLGDVFVLQFQSQPGRLDWHLVPRQTEESNLVLSQFGPIEDGLGRALDLMSGWLGKNSITASRVALGATLVSPVQSRLEGYKELLELVPSLRFEPNESTVDLFFQINRLKESKVLSQPVNRLMKWSVGRGQPVSIRITSGAPTVAAPIDAIEYYCRLELDLSTVPAADVVFDAAQIDAIFGELGAMALEIAQGGELA